MNKQKPAAARRSAKCRIKSVTKEYGEKGEVTKTTLDIKMLVELDGDIDADSAERALLILRLESAVNHSG